MRPSFNTAGPCLPGEHYMVPPERRLGPARELIDEGKYFTLTAGRQTGKKTSLRWLVAHYRETGTHAAIWVNLQLAREEPDPAVAFNAILRCLDLSVANHLPEVSIPAERASYLASPATALVLYLRDLARRCSLPLVVLFDEADGLVGKAMVSFLTQLRAGYIARPEQPFPYSVALVGMQQDDAIILPTFMRVDIEDLLAQHTAATGQRFEADATDRVFDLSQGHPWLVNALADHAVRREAPDRATLVTAAHIEAAKERIILDRRTHIDSLISKLREPRVRRILDPMIAGERTRGDELDDDFAYAIGLGLLRRNNGTYEIANPIYREVIPRALTYVDQGQIQIPTAPFVRADGSLDLPKLMAAWQDFWREDGHLAAEGFHYRESGPHLMLMAFLQRIINGGGRIEREYALGRGALDLIIEWKDTRHVLEVKVRRDSHTEERAIEQIVAYLDSMGLTEGWLIIFDLRSTLSWSERLWAKDVVHAGKRIHLVGC